MNYISLKRGNSTTTTMRTNNWTPLRSKCDSFSDQLVCVNQKSWILTWPQFNFLSSSPLRWYCWEPFLLLFSAMVLLGAVCSSFVSYVTNRLTTTWMSRWAHKMYGNNGILHVPRKYVDMGRCRVNAMSR